MKKKLLAIVLTVVTIITSLSMLSLPSVAGGTAPDVYSGIGGNSTFTVSESSKRVEGIVCDSDGLIGDREITFTMNVTMNAYNFNELIGGAYPQKYQWLTYYQPNGESGVIYENADHGEKLLFVPSAKLSESLSAFVAFQIVNDTTDGLVLVHETYDGALTAVVLGSAGTDISVKIVWNADDSGEIIVDGESRATIAQMSTIKADAGSNAGTYFASPVWAEKGYTGMMFIEDNNSQTNGFSSTFSEYTTTVYDTESVYDPAKKIYAGLEGTSGGAIKLDDSSALSYGKVISSGSMAGEREIEYTLNIASMQAYNFNELLGGHDSGYDDKYEWVAVHEQPYGESTHDNGGLWMAGANIGPWFEKIVFFPTANLDDQYAGCIVTHIVNDVTDGLVLIHTSYSGRMTFIKIGQINEDIDLKFIWNSDDSGEILVNGESKAAFIAGEMSTIKADYTSKNGNDKTPGLYYGRALDSTPATFGFQFVQSENGAQGFSATVSGYRTSVVPATEPSIKLSYVQETAPAGDPATVDVRFTATVNTLEASMAGFEISLKDVGTNTVDKSTNVVYKTILANSGGEIEEISASDGEYLVSVNVNGVKTDAAYTFIVKPYLLGLDGNTRIYGQSYEVTYTNGIYTSCTAVK